MNLNKVLLIAGAVSTTAVVLGIGYKLTKSYIEYELTVKRGDSVAHYRVKRYNDRTMTVELKSELPEGFDELFHRNLIHTSVHVNFTGLDQICNLIRASDVDGISVNVKEV